MKMTSTTYGYARVSSSSQSLERQKEQLKQFVTDERFIFSDVMSGESFNRKEYNSLVGTKDVAPRLKEGDLLVVVDLDRLGRNYIEIRKEWEYITKTLKADIKVIDMPLLDTSTATDSLDMRFIADLVLQLLSYMAEKERENIRKRQRQGIDVMPIVDGKRVSAKTGRPVGKPRAVKPDNWDEVHSDWRIGKITAVRAMEILGLKPNTFYKFANEEDKTRVYKKRTNEDRLREQEHLIEKAIATEEEL
jgi:DNA invertase Pin-like site-specific DNA recombinase